MEDCEHRGATLDGKKCYCIPWERWTNCLEVGQCVKDTLNETDCEEEQCKEEN